MQLLITGSSGFIGSSLLLSLKSTRTYSITTVIRNKKNQDGVEDRSIVMNTIDQDSDWSETLFGINTVIHLAARAHILNDQVSNPLAAFRETNTYATLNLAQQAANAGVRRFIFISSIGVNGNQTHTKPFAADDLPTPAEPYAISKHEAEIGLRQIAAETGMEVVIIRPPLVYGANAPGNFGQLIKTVARGIPLPLGSIHNQRSLVALPNLIDLITTCIDHPAAANQTFLVSDGEDLSTTELLQRLSRALGKPARLLPIPQSWLETALTLVGKRAIAQRLCGNLQVDISKTRDLLGWTPPVSVDEALRQTAQAYLQAKR
ncbi:UDP-glucose 4-epimerase family protein [Thiothrix subterranea]|uniref:SDR family oxidoreductase n=1 Tax=Thiothrix subterranea TaxID=2735563 RepID=A0ABU0Y758_9GAMM|nr:SDR family oxidoreductase [Thiothrix subterranea]MDQ5767552.1 SDR family oxidoreductase [Thiothrix subterranea]